MRLRHRSTSLPTVVTVNDVLYELQTENKRLFNELLFANKCLLKLRLNLNSIYSKIETIVSLDVKQVLFDLTLELNEFHNKSSDGLKGDIDDHKKCSNSHRLRRRCQTQVSHQNVSHLSDTRVKSEENDKLNDNNVKSKQTAEVVERRGRKRLKASVGNQSIKRKFKYRRHQDLKERSHQYDKYWLSCDNTYCDYKCRNQSLLDKHMSRHSKQLLIPTLSHLKKWYDLTTNLFICPDFDCKKSCEGKDILIEHLKADHSTQLHSCTYDDCQKWYISRKELRNHMNSCHINSAKCCAIDGCQYKYTSIHSLKTHMLKHTNERPVVCPVEGCGLAFKSKNGLNTHSKVHTTEPTVKCTAAGCNQLFYRSYNMYKHKVNEHNFKPYVRPNPRKVIIKRCEWPGCDYKGNSKDVDIHKLTHTGERPHVCDWPECDKRFRFIGSLKEHKNIHLNLKPYACHWPGCQYSTGNRGNARKHYIQVHVK